MSGAGRAFARCTTAVVAAAALALARTVYRAAVTTVPGWNQPQSDLHLLKRLSVHEDIAADKASFMARVAGLR